MRKYFDEKGYLVGFSFGDMTENFLEDYDISNGFEIIRLFHDMPKRKGYTTHVKEQIIDGIASYSYEFVEIPKEDWDAELTKEMMVEEILDSIVVNEKPAAKEGFILKPVLSGNHIVWEFEAEPAPVPEEDVTLGTYLNPIHYVSGMEVKITKWYTDGEDIWECIQSGIPTGFDDTNYFEIITL